LPSGAAAETTAAVGQSVLVAVARFDGLAAATELEPVAGVLVCGNGAAWLACKLRARAGDDALTACTSWGKPWWPFRHTDARSSGPWVFIPWAEAPTAATDCRGLACAARGLELDWAEFCCNSCPLLAVATFAASDGLAALET